MADPRVTASVPNERAEGAPAAVPSEGAATGAPVGQSAPVARPVMTRWRAVAIAVSVALVLCAAALVALCTLLPPQSDVGAEGKDFGYVYSGPKSASTAFTIASMPDDSMLLFGSSELSTPPSLISQVPPVVFGQHSCGVNETYIGEAYDPCLWQTIAAGAYAQNVQNKKVAIIVSPSWFFDGGLDNALFKTRFSYSLYREFMANPLISDATKELVRARVAEQGIDASVVAAGTRSGLIEQCNDAVYALIDDLKLRSDLRAVREKGFAHETGGTAVPRFDVLRKQAIEEAKTKSTNNDWGFDDASYTENVGDNREAIKGKLAGETFTDTPEYDDFDCFLAVCSEAGLEPLVIVAPLSGDYYDWVGVDAHARQSCYERILNIADKYGAKVADFTDREYERYFLHDMVHFGWTGWVDVDQALYEFAKGV